MTRLIGICGQGPKSGKSEAAKIIYELLKTKLSDYARLVDGKWENVMMHKDPWLITRFANQPKKIVSELTNIRFENLNSQEYKDKLLKGWDNPQGIPRTGRDLIKDVAEGMREWVGDDVWVKALFKGWGSGCHWLIDDVRKIPEARKIKQEGGIIIKVMNTNAEKGEVELPDEFVDYWVDNNAYNTGYPELLEMQIKKVLERERLING